MLATHCLSYVTLITWLWKISFVILSVLLDILSFEFISLEIWYLAVYTKVILWYKCKTICVFVLFIVISQFDLLRFLLVPLTVIIFSDFSDNHDTVSRLFLCQSDNATPWLVTVYIPIFKVIMIYAMHFVLFRWESKIVLSWDL